MTILVFGGTGQVGRALRQRGGSAVTVLARPEGDLTRTGAVAAAFARYRPAVVINAAAYTAVDRAESEPDAAFAVNRDGPHRLAEACREAGAVLLHISTDYVFDGSKAGAYTEDDPVAPLGVYGASKEAGERAVRETWDRHVILRTAWVYSPFGHNFVRTMLRLAGERDTLRVVDDQTGCPTAAGDIADTLLTLARRLDGTTAGPFGTYHYCGGGATTWCGFARAIVADATRRSGRTVTVEAITTADYPTPARRPANSVLDCGRLERIFGITPRPWPQALAGVMAELLDHRQEGER